jgi:hypothetical protein
MMTSSVVSRSGRLLGARLCALTCKHRSMGVQRVVQEMREDEELMVRECMPQMFNQESSLMPR